MVLPLTSLSERDTILPIFTHPAAAALSARNAGSINNNQATKNINMQLRWSGAGAARKHGGTNRGGCTDNAMRH